MAKPFLALATELPTAFATAQADLKSYQMAQEQSSKDMAAAKATFDASVAAIQATAKTAADKAAESERYLRTIQEEINAQLGRSFDARVRGA